MNQFQIELVVYKILSPLVTVQLVLNHVTMQRIPSKSRQSESDISITI